jgi:hypothetical protein
MPTDRSIQIGAIENNKGRIASEFKGELLHGGGALLHEQAADFRGIRKGDFAYIRIACQFAPNLL